MNNEELWKLNEKEYEYLSDKILSKIKDILYGIAWCLVYSAVVYFVVIWRF